MNRRAVIHCDAIGKPESADLRLALDGIIARELSRKAIVASELFDFSPDPVTGRSLDRALYAKLERCLGAESAHSQEHFFSPIAYHQVLLRISRYLWLKDCIENLIRRTGITHLHLTSDKDADLHSACLAVSETARITFSSGAGDMPPPSNIIHRLGPYGLPRLADPLPLVWLRCLVIKLKASVGAIYSEPRLEDDGKARTEPLKVHRQVALLEAIRTRLLYVLTGRKKELLTPVTRDQVKATLSAPLWREQFSPDELEIISAALGFFFSIFSATLLRKLARNMELFFKAAAPSLVVLSHDRADINRLAAYSARRCGIPVAYFPHGIVWEDYSEPNINSPFSPHFVLAWTEDSRHAFQRSGWRGYTVRFPRYQREAKPYKPLRPLSHAEPKILYLLPEWLGATRAGREDCLIHDLMLALEAVTRLGIGHQNLHLKYHSGPKANGKIKEATMARLQSVLDAPLTIIPPETDSLSIIGNYDLVFSMLTSGLYEAVLQGVPAVIVGLSHERIGTLARHALPHAQTSKELITVLKNFDNEALAKAYREIAQSLQSPPKIGMVRADIDRDWRTDGGDQRVPEAGA